MAQWASAFIALFCAIATMVSAYTTLRVRLELATFKNDLKDWINGSFMRTKEVQAILHGYEERLANLEGIIEKMISVRSLIETKIHKEM